jgi:hypothetical protein
MRLRFSLDDVSALRRPLLALALVIGAVAASVSLAERSLKNARATLAQARTELAEAQKRVQRSGEERDTIQRYLGPYAELAQRGVLGEEQRLAWVDALRSANAETELYGVDYEVGVRQPYAYPTEAGADGLSAQQSVMKLKFGLLYEQDLLDFFGALARQQVGAFAVNQCVLKRLVDESARPANTPTLRAECDVAWITIPAEAGS